jgi:hypothetical protein
MHFHSYLWFRAQQTGRVYLERVEERKERLASTKLGSPKEVVKKADCCLLTVDGSGEPANMGRWYHKSNMLSLIW